MILANTPSHRGGCLMKGRLLIKNEVASFYYTTLPTQFSFMNTHTPVVITDDTLPNQPS